MKRAATPWCAFVACAVALQLAGCGARPPSSASEYLQNLRRDAAAEPRNASLQRELAIAEMLAPGGDAGRTGRQIGRALALAPRDERLLFLAGIERDAHGQPSEAVELFMRAIEAARVSREQQAPFVAEAAVAYLKDIADVTPRFAQRFRTRLRAVSQQPGRVGIAALSTVGDLEVDLAYKRGDTAEVRRLAAAQGCTSTWRIAGPFGPRELLGFDQVYPPERTNTLEAMYDLGPDRGTRATRDQDARGCSVHLGDGPVTAGGTTYAEAIVETPRGSDYVMRLETPNAVQVLIDGRSAVRLDMRSIPKPRVTFHRVRLGAGRHRFLVKISTRHPNPVVVLKLVEAPSGEDPDALQVDGLFTSLLRAVVMMARGAPVQAREQLRALTRDRNSTALLMSLRAAVALSDPMLPADMQRDEARRALRTAATRDPLAWYPVLQLARLEAADGRILSAVTALEQAVERWPNVLALHLTLADFLYSRGWDAQAERAINRGVQAGGDTCRMLSAALQAAEKRDVIREIVPRTEALVQCDARSNARYALLVRQRRWDEARAELERLATLEPRQSRALLSPRLDIAQGRNDEQGIGDAIDAMTTAFPLYAAAPLAKADWLLSQDRLPDARGVLDEALDREPAAMADLRRIRRAITGEFELASYRLDGRRVLQEFEASGRTYDAPQVLVLDYTIVRVYPDGSSLELTHNITKVQSAEAVDQQGEFEVPEDAHLLTLHTVKSDGRRIEPDAIPGKDTLSLPNLAPGDYTEFEYVRALAPPAGFPGGYLGNRFYFKSFEIPFDLSQLTVILPRDMHVVIDPRGPAPETQDRIEGDLRVLRWTEHESRPLVQEPASVNAREFIPSINIGVSATWNGFVESLREVLADRDPIDPAAKRELLQILGRTRGMSQEARARRLYAWVLERIEDSNEVFGLAPAMLVDRNGHRGRILHYLFRLAGLRSQLVLVRSKSADSNVSPLPDEDTYEHLLVLLTLGDKQVMLSTGERGAPFGYVPPLLRGQDALVLADGAPRIRLAPPVDGQDLHQVALDVALEANGSARVDVTETYHGAGAVAWRGNLEGIPQAVLEQRFEESYVSQLVPGATLDGLRIRDRENPERPLVIQYTFRAPALGRSAGDRWAIPGLYPANLAPMYARQASRTTTQLVAPPQDLQVTMKLRVPSGSSLPAAPRDVTLRGPGGASFQMNARARDGALQIDRRIRVPILRISPRTYPAFAAFCRRVDEAEGRELAVRLSR